MSGSRPAQMSATATASRRESVGERVEHRRRPVVRQRLVDGPDAPAGLALANGGERLADCRRVVAVVVVDDDAGGLALSLEAPADAAERCEAARRSASAATPSTEAAPATAERVGSVVAAGRGEAGRDRTAVRVETEISSVVPDAVRGGDPAEDVVAGPAPSRTAPRSRGIRRRARCGAVVHERVRDDRPRPVGQRRGELATPASPTFATSVGVRPARPADPPLERRDHVRRVPKHVGVVPFGAGQRSRRRVVGVEVARVLVRLDDERRPCAPASRRRSADPRQLRGQQRADECARDPRRRPTRTWTSQPAVVLLPCVPATPTSRRPTAASATTCCHGSTGIPAARAASSSGVCGSIAVSALVTASRSGCGGAVTCVAACCRRDRGCRARRAPACTATARRGRTPSRPRRPERRAIAAALAPAPAAPTTWIRSPGPDRSRRPRRRQTRGHPFGGGRHPSVASSRPAASTRSIRSSRAATALWRLFSDLSPLQT